MLTEEIVSPYAPSKETISLAPCQQRDSVLNICLKNVIGDPAV